MTGKDLVYDESSRLESEIEDVVMRWCKKENISALKFKVSINMVGDCIWARVIA